MVLPIINTSCNINNVSAVETAVTDAITIITHTRVPPPPWETVEQRHIRPSERRTEELESYAFPGCTPETKPWGLSINLSSLYIGSTQAARIGRALILNQTVTTLDLSMCDLYSDGCEALVKCLKRNYILKHLSLSGNKIGPRGAVAIAEYLSMDNTGILESASPRTKLCSFQANSTCCANNNTASNITDVQCHSTRCFTTAAASPPITMSPVAFHSLQTPSPIYIPPNKALYSVPIPYDRKYEYDKNDDKIPSRGSDTVVSLDGTKKRVHNQYVNHITVSESSMEKTLDGPDKGMNGFCSVVDSSAKGIYPDLTLGINKDIKPPPPCYLRCPLQSLSLSFNAIGDEGVICIMNSLRTNRELKFLNLRGNNITNLGAFAVLDALQDHYTLEDDLVTHAANVKKIARSRKERKKKMGSKNKRKEDESQEKRPNRRVVDDDDREGPKKEETREAKLAKVNKEAPKPPKSCLPYRLRFDIDTVEEEKQSQLLHDEALVKYGLKDMKINTEFKQKSVVENAPQIIEGSDNAVINPPPELFQVLFRLLSGEDVPSLTSPFFILPSTGDDNNPAVTSVKEKKKAISDALIAANVTNNDMAETLLDKVSMGDFGGTARILMALKPPYHNDEDEITDADITTTNCKSLNSFRGTNRATDNNSKDSDRFDAPTGSRVRAKAFSARWKGMKVEQRLEFIQFNFPQFSSLASMFLIGQTGVYKCASDVSEPYVPNPLLHNAMKILSTGNHTLKLSVLISDHHDDSNNINMYNNMLAVNSSSVANDLLYHPSAFQATKPKCSRSSEMNTGDIRQRTENETDKLLVTSMLEPREYPSLLENTGGFFYPTLAISPNIEGLEIPPYHVLHTSHVNDEIPRVILYPKSPDSQRLAANQNNNEVNPSLSLFPQKNMVALANIFAASGFQFVQKQMIEAMRFNSEVKLFLDGNQRCERVKNVELQNQGPFKETRDFVGMSDTVNLLDSSTSASASLGSLGELPSLDNTQKTVQISCPVLPHKSWKSEASIPKMKRKENEKNQKKPKANIKSDKAESTRKMVSELQIKETGYCTALPSSHVKNLAINTIQSQVTSSSLYKQCNVTTTGSPFNNPMLAPHSNSSMTRVIEKEAKIAAMDDYHFNSNAFRIYGSDVDENIKNILYNRSNKMRRIKEIEEEIQTIGAKKPKENNNMSNSIDNILSLVSTREFDGQESLIKSSSSIKSPEFDEEKKHVLYDEICALRDDMTVLNHDLLKSYNVKKDIRQTPGTEVPSILKEHDTTPRVKNNRLEGSPPYIYLKTGRILSGTLRDRPQNSSVGSKQQRRGNIALNKPLNILPVELQFIEMLSCSLKRDYYVVSVAKESEESCFAKAMETHVEQPDKIAHEVFQVEEVRPMRFQTGNATTKQSRKQGNENTSPTDDYNRIVDRVVHIRQSPNTGVIGGFDIIKTCSNLQKKLSPKSQFTVTVSKMDSKSGRHSQCSRKNSLSVSHVSDDGTEQQNTNCLPSTLSNRSNSGSNSQAIDSSRKNANLFDDCFGTAEFEGLPPPLPLPTLRLSDLHPVGMANRNKRNMALMHPPMMSSEKLSSPSSTGNIFQQQSEHLSIPRHAVPYIPLASILTDLMRSPLYVLVDPLTAFLRGRERDLSIASCSDIKAETQVPLTVPTPLDPRSTPEGLAVIIANHLQNPLLYTDNSRVSRLFERCDVSEVSGNTPTSSLASTRHLLSSTKTDFASNVNDPLSSTLPGGSFRNFYNKESISSYEVLRTNYPILCSTLKRVYEPPKIERNTTINSIWLQMNDDVDPILQHRIQQCLSMRCPVYPPELTKKRLKQLLAKRKKNHEEIPIEYADMILSLELEDTGRKIKRENNTKK